MLALLGTRRRQILRLLLRRKGGVTVDEISRAVGVTRNAVRQHVAALEKEGLVAAGPTRPTRGRPEQLYVLTDAGREFFPRQYAWFAQLVVEAIKADVGTEGLRKRLRSLGAAVGKNLRARSPGPEGRAKRVARLAALMQELGYEARVAPGAVPTIEADNCVFHDLAQRHPEVCQFDLALLSTFTDGSAELTECMAKGGSLCRFRFRGPKKD